MSALAAASSPDIDSAGRWLSLVGLGEDGRAGLTQAALDQIAGAELIVGGRRHLDLLGNVAAETLAWPSPIEDAYPEILARRRRPVVVLASGDPFFYGVGSVLARLVPPKEMCCLPAASAFSLAAARLGWAIQGCRILTLHGRAFECIRPHLQPGGRLLILSWDGTTPLRVADELVRRGMGASRLVVLEAMGGPRERRVDCLARDMADQPFDPLNTVAVEIAAGAEAEIIGLVPGRPDDGFENDGQITRSEVRAVTLAALQPRSGEMLWDIGGGSGSIGIEWMLADTANRAVSIEPRSDRAERIVRNARTFGVPGLTVVEGKAPTVLAGLEEPDAVFVGGGLTAPGVFEAAWKRLRSGGRFVANGVTLETQSRLAELHERHGGRLIEIRLAEVSPVGGFRALRPLLPILQWSVRKP